MFHDMLTIRSAVYVLIKYFNPLMPGGNKKVTHTILKQTCSWTLSVQLQVSLVCVTFLLPPGIKGLNVILTAKKCGYDHVNLTQKKFRKLKF